MENKKIKLAVEQRINAIAPELLKSAIEQLEKTPAKDFSEEWAESLFWENSFYFGNKFLSGY